MPDRPLLEVDGLCAGWDGHEVLHGLTFTVGVGELLTVLGPNGSGKTTLLRTIAGFERPTAGTVRLAGASLAGVPPHRRSVGLLFQDATLFARRTVFENVAYAPLLQRRPEGEVRALVDSLAELLSLGRLLDRRPEQLSGGERQRVALARTLAARPRVVLLDEPFASVDVDVRAGLRAEFREALRAFGTAAVHVTHDREEGLFLADRLALLFDGSFDAIGSPAEVYGAPRSQRAARFLGYNVLETDRGAVAVLPEELHAQPDDGSPPRYRVRASGPVGRGYLSVVQDARGRRYELRAPEPLPVGSWVRLRWERGVPLRETAGPRAPGP